MKPKPCPAIFFSPESKDSLSERSARRFNLNLTEGNSRDVQECLKGESEHTRVARCGSSVRRDLRGVRRVTGGSTSMTLLLTLLVTFLNLSKLQSQEQNNPLIFKGGEAIPPDHSESVPVNTPAQPSSIPGGTSTVSTSTVKGNSLFPTTPEKALKLLIGGAIQKHPSMSYQKSLVRGAEAAAKRALWQFGPSVSASVEQEVYSSSTPVGPENDQILILSIQQPLWTWGRLSGQLSRANVDVSLRQLELELAREELALRVLNGWSDVMKAQKVLAAYADSRASHAQLLKTVERRVKEGASTPADKELAHARLEAVESYVAGASSRLESAENSLQVLTGLKIPKQKVELEKTPLISDLKSLLAFANKGSPRVLRAQARLKKKELDLSLAKVNHLPELFIRGAREYGLDSSSSTGPLRCVIGFSATTGAGLSSFFEARESQAYRDAALDEAQIDWLELERQIQENYSLTVAARVKSEALERSCRSSVQVFESWERQFFAGHKQWQDLMNAAQELAQSSVQLAESQVGGWQSYWILRILCYGTPEVL